MKDRLKKFLPGEGIASGSESADLIHSTLTNLQSDVSGLRGHIGSDESIPRSVRLNLDTLRLMSVEPIYSELRHFMKNHCLDFDQTMERLGRQDMGLARFGDGEFKVMLRADGKHKFQDVVPNLQRELKDVIENSSVEKMLVGLPHLFNNPFWSNIWASYYPDLKPLFKTETDYVCAHVTRPIYFRTRGASAAESWRQVWDGMRAVVVTGRNAKFDLIPELFDTLDGAEFIRGPNRNAYFELDDLERSAVENQADVVLISLGPAGTVLAHRLARAGIHALDIGHISASYKNVFHGDVRPEEL